MRQVCLVTYGFRKADIYYKIKTIQNEQTNKQHNKIQTNKQKKTPPDSPFPDIFLGCNHISVCKDTRLLINSAITFAACIRELPQIYVIVFALSTYTLLRAWVFGSKLHSS